MPSQVSRHVGPFDRFAGMVSRMVSRGRFFAFCVALVVVWAPTYFVVRDFDTWQLLINTPTTIITYLLVALLQNSGQRDSQAEQHKLNAIAAAMAIGLGESAGAAEHDGDLDQAARLRRAERELRAAVGLEERESA